MYAAYVYVVDLISDVKRHNYVNKCYLLMKAAVWKKHQHSSGKMHFKSVE